MVEPQGKKWLVFGAFVLPCFVLYIVFFITPFINGVGISFTNWDGLESKAPMAFSDIEFESQVLGQVKKNGKPRLSDGDKEYLQTVYKHVGKEYKREGIHGLQKYKVEGLIKKSGFVPKNYAFVGMKNYQSIFTGGNENFYPKTEMVSKYNITSSLPFFVEKNDFDFEIMRKVQNPDDAALLSSAYTLKETEKKSRYVLSNEFNEVEISKQLDSVKITPNVFKSFVARVQKLAADGNTDAIDDEQAKLVKSYSIGKKDAEVVKNAAQSIADGTGDTAAIIAELEKIDVRKNVISNFSKKLKEVGLSGDKDAVAKLLDSFMRENEVADDGDVKKVANVGEHFLEIAKLKNIIHDAWVVKNFKMGVMGFTLFFAVFSVLGINILAFALALALDSGIRGQKILRTIYFLPNVLSMIIVALIWNMLFSQLLPAITGIQAWIMDANKTPWLLVLVATWQGAGYYMIIYLAGLQNIPQDIIEAAMIDGATWKQRFFNITLPMMIPSLTISLFLTIANAFKSFDLMYALIGPSGYATGTVPIVYDIFFQAYTKHQAGSATAEAMLLFLVIVVISGIQLYVMKKKEVEA